MIYTFSAQSRIEVKATDELKRRIKTLQIADVMYMLPSVYVHRAVFCEFNTSRTIGYIQFDNIAVAQDLITILQYSRITLADGFVYRINAKTSLQYLPVEIGVQHVLQVVGYFIHNLINMLNGRTYQIVGPKISHHPHPTSLSVPTTELGRKGSDVWIFLPAFFSHDLNPPKQRSPSLTSPCTTDTEDQSK